MFRHPAMTVPGPLTKEISERKITYCSMSCLCWLCLKRDIYISVEIGRTFGDKE